MKRFLVFAPFALGVALFVACSGYAPVNRGNIDLVILPSASASASAAPKASAPPAVSEAPRPPPPPPLPPTIMMTAPTPSPASPATDAGAQ
jgi:hypothetical protein